MSTAVGGADAGHFGLIGDIGATNGRFSLVTPGGHPSTPRSYVLGDYASFAAMIEAYLADEAPPQRPSRAVLAVASPVTGDVVTLTNHPWTFSTEALRRRLGLDRVDIVNDFAANAAAIPRLTHADCLQIGGGTAADDAPAAVIGPGTGLGIAALVPVSKCTTNGAVVIAGEGGHATMAPATAEESAIVDLMRTRFDHVSAERLLCGPGLVNLYNARCEIRHVPAQSLSPDQITSPEIWKDDHEAHATTAMFCAMLGTVAGNLALTLGARGGVYIAGGIVPRFPEFFARSEFRARFEAKGRLGAYLASVPVFLIMRPVPALVGAAAILDGGVAIV
jgi:glucokinase